MKEFALIALFIIIWAVGYIVVKKPFKNNFYSHAELSKHLLDSQRELDYNFLIESSPEDIKESRDCKKLFKYLNRRRKKVSRLVKIIDKLYEY